MVRELKWRFYTKLGKVRITDVVSSMLHSVVLTLWQRRTGVRLEVLHLTEKEKRVLLHFDPQQPTPDDQRVLGYLEQHGLEPKRQYTTTKDGKDYLTYYFGHCYLEKHLDHLTQMADSVSLSGAG
jgi:hypothetical protein